MKPNSVASMLLYRRPAPKHGSRPLWPQTGNERALESLKVRSWSDLHGSVTNKHKGAGSFNVN